MIGKFKTWMKGAQDSGEVSSSHDRLQLSVAVLLAEIARADYENKDVEAHEIRRQLMRCFDLPEDVAAELAAIAETRVEDSVSLHEFTNAVHEEMDTYLKRLAEEHENELVAPPPLP